MSRHLQLLLTFCHGKQHSGAAVALLAQCVRHISGDQPNAALSIMATLAHSLGICFCLKQHAPVHLLSDTATIFPWLCDWHD